MSASKLKPPSVVKTVHTILQIIYILTPFLFCNGQQLTTEYLSVPLPYATCPVAFYDGEDSIYLTNRCLLFPDDDNILKFSISSETIEVVGTLPGSPYLGSVEADDSGNIFFFSGGGSWNEVYKYDPALNTTSTIHQMALAYGHSSFKVNSSTVLLLGGGDDAVGLWAFNLETSASSREATLPFAVYAHTSVRVGTKAYTFDDTDTEANQYALELDLENLTMETVGPATLPVFEYYPSSVGDGEFIYILGGYHPYDGHRSDGLIQFDPITFENNFIPVANLLGNNDTYFYYSPASVFVPSRNRIYGFGGQTYDGHGEFQDLDGIFYIDLSPLGPSTTTTEGPTTTLNPELFTCLNRTDGIYPHPTDCSKFIECLDEEMEIFSCPPPLLFDPVLKVCNPDLVECPLSCLDKPDGLYPHPGDCALFIDCQSGVTNVSSCPAPLLFDPETLTCDDPSQVTCA